MSGCGGCASANERCGNGLEKIYPTTAVRFGRMRHIGEFSHAADMKFSCGAKVVISTDRGIEIGEQVSLTCHSCDKSVTRDQMIAYAHNSGGDSYRLKSGRILREATEEDLLELRHIEDSAFDRLQDARRAAADLGLEMKIVDAEHIFGGERIVLYFMSEQRVDFRDLVRQLATEFQTRVEMRQVGARDEARLLADYETCGRECCCKNFLKNLKPVSMSMAKLQKATLDLSKISGRCGRLKCCLRYEHESYQSLDRKLPRNGVWVSTAHGVGQIIDRQVLTQLLKLRGADGKILTVAIEDVQEVDVAAPPPPDPDARAGRGRERPARPERGRRREEPRPAAEPAAAAPPADDTPPETPGTEASAAEGGAGGSEGPTSAEETGPNRADRQGQRRGRRRRRGRRPGGPRPGGGGSGG